MQNFRLVTLFSFLIIAMVGAIVGCGEKGTIEAVSNAEPQKGGDTGGNRPDQTGSRSPGVDRTGPGNETGGKYALVFVGGGITGFNLYTMSPGAHDALPSRFPISFDKDYVDVRALPGHPDSAIAISRKQLGSQLGQAGNTLELIHFSTTNSYTLYHTDIGTISDVSPSIDGELVVFTESASDNASNGKTSHIKVLNIQAETVTDLSRVKATEKVFDHHPRFIGGTSKVTFIRRISSLSQVLVRSLKADDPDEPGLLPESSMGDQEIRYFEYSPDLTSYLYLKQFGKGTDLYVVTTSGGEKNETKLTANGESDLEPSWSPQGGKKIVFLNQSKTAQTIKVYDLNLGLIDALANVRVTDQETGRICPAWSPNAGEVFYASNTGYFTSIYRTNISSKLSTKLTDSNIPPSYFCPQVMGLSEEIP